MQISAIVLIGLVAMVINVVSADGEPKLKIGIKKRVPGCKVKSRKGDLIFIHYTVSWAKEAATTTTTDQTQIINGNILSTGNIRRWHPI